MAIRVPGVSAPAAPANTSRSVQRRNYPMQSRPPPGGWTLQEAAEALCPEAARLHAEGGPSPSAALRDALAARPQLQLTGIDLAGVTGEPRFRLPAFVLHTANSAPSDRQWLALILDLAGDAAIIVCDLASAKRDFSSNVHLASVRVETTSTEAPAARRFSRAPAPPRLVRGGGGHQSVSVEARIVARPVQPPAPAAPPGGWPLAEAAAALLPDLYVPASLPPSATHWMSGGAEPHKQERDALRLAFARLMETGDFVADGIALKESEPSNVPPHLWRAAIFPLGLPGEAPLDTVMASGRWWSGVRVKRYDANASAAVLPAIVSAAVACEVQRQPVNVAAVVPPVSALELETRAVAWMRENVCRPRQWKRDVAIVDCCAATRCKSRVARAAWDALPTELKGTRGRPPKAKG
jgi:hypothetical protein